MSLSWKARWYRLTHWEYWSYAWVYYPLFPIWLWYALKERSLFFFSASNPAMAYGGLTLESKMEIYKMIPDAISQRLCSFLLRRIGRKANLRI
ncbi:hypothetical protein [Aureicoccus marinus]|uniref:hypothetical protein n=1 Tax=Aureicoccus marinus TaxID=754435 RepID=UPI000CF4B091|nr:hypothetical protein [Aureicoccus marinus]